jgi:hypothetical protein
MAGVAAVLFFFFKKKQWILVKHDNGELLKK